MASAGQDLATIDGNQAALYAKRSGRPVADMLTLMDANRGTGRWLSAAEAKAAGLVDEIYDPANRAIPLAAGDLSGLDLPPVPVEFAALFVAAPEQTPTPVDSAASAASGKQVKGAQTMKISAAQAQTLKERFGDAVALAACTQDLEYVGAMEPGVEVLAKDLTAVKAEAVKIGTERDAAQASVADLTAKLAAAEAKLADPLKPSDKREPPATPPTVKPIPEAHAELVKSGKSPADAWAMIRTERPEEYAAHFGMR